MAKGAPDTPAIVKMDAVLEFLKNMGPSRFTDIYKNLDISKSSLYSLIKTMERLGYLRGGLDGTYNLGFRLYELGNSAVSHINLRKECVPFLYELRSLTGLTCHLGVLDGYDAIYLLKLESPDTVKVRTWEGLRLSLHSAALGKALLMDHDDAALSALYPEETLASFTPSTIGSVQQLKAELALSRRRGWAFDDGEHYEDLRCVAAPIRNVDGKIVAAVSVVGAASRIPDDRIGDLAKETVRVCGSISARLGYKG